MYKYTAFQNTGVGNLLDETSCTTWEHILSISTAAAGEGVSGSGLYTRGTVGLLSRRKTKALVTVGAGPPGPGLFQGAGQSRWAGELFPKALHRLSLCPNRPPSRACLAAALEGFCSEQKIPTLWALPYFHLLFKIIFNLITSWVEHFQKCLMPHIYKTACSEPRFSLLKCISSLLPQAHRARTLLLLCCLLPGDPLPPPSASAW